MKHKNSIKSIGLALVGVVLILSAIKVYADTLSNQETQNAKNGQLNLYYGLKSYDSFQKLLQPSADSNTKAIENVSTMAFHWAEVNLEPLTQKIRLQNKMPLGYETPLRLATENSVKTYISFYMASGYDQLFGSSSQTGSTGVAASSTTANAVSPQASIPIDKTITDNPALWFNGQLESVFLKKVSVSGIVIDFESIPKNQQENYLKFLETLQPMLKAQNMELWVAIQPNAVTDYNRLLKTVDRAILMFHDYEAKKLTVNRVENRVLTPLVPLNKLEADLATVKKSIKNPKDLEKLSLQLNMATVQWKVKDKKLLNVEKTGVYAYPYRPEYSTLIQKWQSLVTAVKPVEVGYMKAEASPYLYFYDETDQTYNTVFYENEQSLTAKIELARKYGIEHFSVWRLGNIPAEPKLGLNLEKIILDLGRSKPLK